VTWYEYWIQWETELLRQILEHNRKRQEENAEFIRKANETPPPRIGVKR